MSFCSDIKNELADIKTHYCCKSALIYGFALFSRSFSAKRISMQTENKKSAYCYATLLKDVFDAQANVSVGGGKRPTYVAQVMSEGDRLKILASVDFGIGEKTINTELLEKSCCKGAFIRGVFLSCGHLSNPDKCYRVDFSIREEGLAKELKAFLQENYIESHISKRGTGYTVYIKRNEMIVNLLAFMGSSSRSLQVIEISIIKSVKNNMNRSRNCDSRNISKIVEASINQRRAIEYLQKKGILDTLPQELNETAFLRINNPESSLKEMCELSKEHITVSGLNHRLKRIMDIYESVKNKRE